MQILCGRKICCCECFPLTAGNRRVLCRIIDTAGSGEQPRFKLRCLYDPLEGLSPTSTLLAVSTAIQQSQGDFTSTNKTGNEFALTRAASRASAGNEVGVSCNCKMGCGPRSCRCHKKELKCSIRPHNTDHDRGNPKPPTEHREVSFMPRISWEYWIVQRMARGSECW